MNLVGGMDTWTDTMFSAFSGHSPLVTATPPLPRRLRRLPVTGH
ncbi:MAG: hypothetical protein ACOX2F_00335 [bacterium]